MRQVLFVVSLSFLLASLSLTAAAQHVAIAPAAAAPVMHAAPMHAPPVAGAHPAYAHSGAHPSSQIRQGFRSASSSRPLVRSVAHPATPAPRAAWYPGLPPSSIAPIPPFVPNTPIILPGSTFFGRPCFSGFGCFPGTGNGFGFNSYFGFPFGRGQFLTSGVIIPFGGIGGFYVPVPYYEPAPPEEGEGAPESANVSEGAENPSNPQAAEAPTVPAAAPSFYPPSEPIYEYVFVKRDGTKIFAVAYSLTNDKLQYVTKEGLRRTLPLEALDFEATQKSNEERGNTVNLPTPPPSAMARAF